MSFEGLARLCGKAAGVKDVDMKLYDKRMFDFGDKKAFPMREQHFFCSGMLASYVLRCCLIIVLSNGLVIDTLFVVTSMIMLAVALQWIKP